MSSSFFIKLEERVSKVNSLLCVGLDPHLSELTTVGSSSGTTTCTSTEEEEERQCDAAFSFCKTIIDTTAPYAACYKPNVAFFEALGVKGGMACLQRVIDAIPTEIPVLLDVKRGDIGTTATAYASSCYDLLKADAVTLSPLMGWDSIEPFVTGGYSNKGAFLLCKTSNPGSNDLLGLNVSTSSTLYETIAHLVGHQWTSGNNNLGLVAGATDAVALQKVRMAAGDDVWILAPGVGAQGGNLDDALRAGLNSHGTKMLIPVSRGISRADNPATAAKTLQEQINAIRIQLVQRETSSSSAAAAVVADAEPQQDTILLQPYQRNFLEFSLDEGVLKFGSFVLKSGRTSPYFFNAGLFASGAALHKLGKAYASSIMASSELSQDGTVNFDVVFGPAYKGISLGALVCAALHHDFGINVGFAYNRKEAKDHGEGGKLVGAPMEDKRVLVVDDVITAGTAIRESYDMLTAIGATVTGVAIALDRAEKRSLDDPVSAVQAVARDLQVPVVSIVSLPQLQMFLEKASDFDDSVLESVTKYRAEYGV